jgi:hypothetical protein
MSGKVEAGFPKRHATVNEPRAHRVPLSKICSGVENEMKSDDKTAQTGSEMRAFPTDEGKSREIFEILIDPANEIIGGSGTTFIEILKNSQQVRPGFVRKDDPHPARYLTFGERA